MTISFTLGLSQIQNELILMQSPGCYWVTVDRQDDARLLVRQIVAAQPTLTLISSVENSRELLIPPAVAGDAEVPLFFVDRSAADLQQLTDNLSHNLSRKPQFLLFFNDATLWDTLTPEALLHWLQTLQGWLARQQSTMLIISQAGENHALYHRLCELHAVLDGLATLQPQPQDWQYQIRWWRYQGGELQDKCFPLTTDSHGFTLRKESEPAINDTLLLLACQDAVADILPVGNQWTLFDDEQQLLRAAEHASAATVVFTLSHHAEVAGLAAHVHRLRRQRGSALKMVIRELHTALRYSDERLLLACGVNAVVPVNTPGQRFLATIDDVQGQVFNRFVAENINVLLKTMQPVARKGLLPVADFRLAVQDLLNHSGLPVDGKGLLVALQPLDGLSVADVLPLCQPRRFGDLLTHNDSQLWLFLSCCRFADLTIALKFIFRQPPPELVALQSVWYGDAQIADELKQLQEGSG